MKAVGQDSDGDTNCCYYTWNDLRKFGKGAGRFRNRSTNHLNYSIVKIGQNTEESPGDLRRLYVTQIQAKKKKHKK